jgi:signal transduction histidine kinase
MKFIQALKLFGFAIGAALQFFLFILLKRNRRIEKLQILFLSLITCLFLWNSTLFLLLLFGTATRMNEFLLSLGVAPLVFFVLAILPSLLLHTHLVFQQKYLNVPVSRLYRVGELVIYFPLPLLPLALPEFLDSFNSGKSILAASSYAQPFAAWFSFSLVASAVIEWRMLQHSRKPQERNLFRALIVIFLSVAGLVLYTYWISDFQVQLEAGSYFETLLLLWSIIPSALLGYYIFRHNFLEIAIQRSLGYSFAGIFLLLVYLLGVRWLRDFMQEAYNVPDLIVDAGMILALFAFSQPLKRWIDSSVDSLFSLEISKFQKMASRIEEVSHSTVEMERLLSFIESVLERELDLKGVKVILYPRPEGLGQPRINDSSRDKGLQIPLLSGDKALGEIQIQGQASNLSTEQQAGIRFLVTQIVSAIESCKLAEGKIYLERELAERDKLATLGQMAATVAHNIKNPLSSIKTIVQLIQEDDEVAVKYARDLSLINSEIDRLSNSVGQLLKFAKPTAPTAADIDLTQVLRKILLIFKAETERRGIRLQFEPASTSLTVRGSEEVLCEVFQNLIVNAIEVSPEQSRIVIETRVLDGNQGKRVAFRIEDQGPGISPEVRPHIFKPFFTTKQKGTGLGLAVVHRRVLDLGGEIDCISPLSQNGGTRFELTLPLKN